MHLGDPWEKLPELAKRLGVEPEHSPIDTVLIRTRGGIRYDLFKLINAFLDRMDAAI